MILNQFELIELTRRVRWSSQARELTTMGIPFRRRSDGSIVVMKEDLQHASAKKGQASPRMRLHSVG